MCICMVSTLCYTLHMKYFCYICVCMLYVYFLFLFIMSSFQLTLGLWKIFLLNFFFCYNIKPKIMAWKFCSSFPVWTLKLILILSYLEVRLTPHNDSFLSSCYCPRGTWWPSSIIVVGSKGEKLLIKYKRTGRPANLSSIKILSAT